MAEIRLKRWNDKSILVSFLVCKPAILALTPPLFEITLSTIEPMIQGEQKQQYPYLVVPAKSALGTDLESW